MFRDATRLHRANRLREFIAAVEERACHDGELTPEKQRMDRVGKREGRLDRPPRQRGDPILDAPEPENQVFGISERGCSITPAACSPLAVSCTAPRIADLVLRIVIYLHQFPYQRR